MGMLSDLMYQRQDGYEPDPRQRVAEQMLLAQNSIPAGMQKHYIDQKLFGPAQPAPAVPTAPQGQRPQGQVGMTILSPEKEAKLRAQLKEWGLPQSEIDRKVLEHKVQSGLR